MDLEIFNVEFVRAHIFQTVWWILFIFVMLIVTVSKFYSAIPCSCLWSQGQGHRLKNFILKTLKSSYFPNHMMDFVHIWYGDRYRSNLVHIRNDNRCSKALFIITPTHAYDLKVKVTDLQILYLIPDNVKFMTTNRQNIAQEILPRAKMP